MAAYILRQMTSSPKRIRLLLADDHALMLEGLRSLLEDRFDIVGVAADGHALVATAAQLKPDVILLDVSMPRLNGIEAARKLSRSLPNSKLIFVTMHADATFVAEAFKAGASGYVIKKSAPEELAAAIGEVCRGRTYVTPLVTRGFLNSVLSPHASPEPFGRLTPRQREVLQLVAEGLSIKQIAGTLHISPKTVEFHKSSLMNALGLRSTAELVKYAVKHGISSIEES